VRSQAPAVFSDHRFQGFFVETEIGDHRLQPPVLVLERPQTPRLIDLQAAVLGSPVVQRLVADAQLPGESRAERPASSCFTAPIICSSLNFVFFISKAPFAVFKGAFQIMTGGDYREQVNSAIPKPRRSSAADVDYRGDESGSNFADANTSDDMLPDDTQVDDSAPYDDSTMDVDDSSFDTGSDDTFV